MKKSLFLFLLLAIGLMAQAQNISVKSFRALPTDLTASSLEGKRIDQNGQVAALIKIMTTEKGFSFEGGTLGIVDSKQEKGEVWVWIPRALRKITIKHSDLGVLRDYVFPVEIEAERTYEMVLTTAKIVTTVEEEVREQYLAFQVSPPNAILEVNDQVWELDAEGSAMKFMSFGMYNYRVYAKDYHTEAGKVKVDDPNNTQKVTVTLKPNFGWIEVTGKDALQGANVFVDDSYVGKAPCKSEALKSGTHTVRIIKEMYATYSQTVTVNDSETTTLTPSLSADFAEVTLKVDADAEIWVNDERKGLRTWKGRLGRGTYKMECRQASHETTVTTKEITPSMNGQTLTLQAPTPIYGSLNIESNPNFAKIYIDGQAMGETPKFISQLLIGQHEIKLTKDGYADYTEAVTITKGERKQVTATLSQGAKDEEIFTVNGVSFTMKLVEGGAFQMGATSEQGSDAESDEKPVHKVTVSTFYMGETEVTQELWMAVMGNNNNPSHRKGDNLPVEQVNWNDIQNFILKLNQKTGKNFRLPTEAEWEYAARGGKKSKKTKYSGSNSLGDVAWYWDNGGSKTHAVKTKSPNELGLYDMSGNVWEWCSDSYGSYSSGSQTNPKGPSSDKARVLRGGSWYFDARDCRVSRRFGSLPIYRDDYFGFRLALPQ